MSTSVRTVASLSSFNLMQEFNCKGEQDGKQGCVDWQSMTTKCRVKRSRSASPTPAAPDSPAHGVLLPERVAQSQRNLLHQARA
jgi:hypothetical protein